MKRIIIFTFALLIIALTAGLFSCDRVVSVASDGEGSEMMGEEITIGVVVALTGQHAEPYGFPMQRGFELAREEINSLGGMNLTFITVDDQSTAEGAKEAVQHLVNQDVPAIVGLAISTHLKEAAPIAQENRVIAFSFSLLRCGFERDWQFHFPHQSRHRYKHSERGDGDSAENWLSKSRDDL